MQIEQTFIVKAAPDVVWSFLTDPNRVASCLPGAQVTGQTDAQTYAGTITVKVGPVTTSYRGTVRFEKLDAGLREAVIVASGQDVRGKGGAEMTMSSRLIERVPGETEVTVQSEVSVSGILAQFGRGMIRDVSDQMFRQFTEAMRAQLEGATVPAPPAPGRAPKRESLDALALGGHVAGRAMGRAVRRPAFWIAAALLALAIWGLWPR